MFNKKAVMGETITWTVATVIIVVFSLLFVFSTVILKDTKKVMDFSLGSLDSGIISDNAELGDSKTMSAFLLTENNYQDLSNSKDTCSYKDFFNKIYGDKWRLEKDGASCNEIIIREESQIFYNLDNGEVVLKFSK